uniref:EF-hand domain-containing protein n=1 Tax=Malurus cyaneus samueli TaxID=2593467 RepID=A0A8C5U1R9_9PASS
VSGCRGDRQEGGLGLRPQRATSNVFAMFEPVADPGVQGAFNMIDQNRDGFIDKEDLHDMLASLGEHTLLRAPAGPCASTEPQEWGELRGEPHAHTQRWTPAMLGCLKAGRDFSAPPATHKGCW